MNMSHQPGVGQLFLKNMVTVIPKYGSTSQTKRHLPESSSSLGGIINMRKLQNCLTFSNTIAKN